MAVLVTLLAVENVSRLGEVFLRLGVLPLLIEHQPVGVGGVGGSLGIVAQPLERLGGLGVFAGGKGIQGAVVGTAVIRRAGGQAYGNGREQPQQRPETRTVHACTSLRAASNSFYKMAYSSTSAKRPLL